MVYQKKISSMYMEDEADIYKIKIAHKINYRD